MPTSLTGTLTWGGTAQTPVTYSTTGLVPGDVVTLAQTAPPVSSTSRHDWSMDAAIPGHGHSTASGVTYTRVETTSPFGAGWTLSALNQLVPIAAAGTDPAGWLWLYGTGGERFFQGTTGTLLGPPEENGVLVRHTGGTFTYTAADSSTIDFSATGAQTDYVTPDGLGTIAYSYTTSGLLSGITWEDGTTTAFNYNTSGQITTIVNGALTWTFTVNPTTGDLTQVTGPDGRTQTFAYTSHLLTDATQGTGAAALADHWTYNAQGLVTSYRWGNSTSVPLPEMFAEMAA